MLSWLMFLIPGRFLFEQPKELHGRLPGSGGLPGHITEVPHVDITKIELRNYQVHLGTGGWLDASEYMYSVVMNVLLDEVTCIPLMEKRK